MPVSLEVVLHFSNADRVCLDFFSRISTRRRDFDTRRYCRCDVFFKARLKIVASASDHDWISVFGENIFLSSKWQLKTDYIFSGVFVVRPLMAFLWTFHEWKWTKPLKKFRFFFVFKDEPHHKFMSDSILSLNRLSICTLERWHSKWRVCWLFVSR